MTTRFLPILVFVAVVVCWVAFGCIFLFRRKPASPPDLKRDPNSIPGVALQCVSYGIVWGLRREVFTTFSSRPPVALIAGTFAVFAAVGSVWIIITAVNKLGKEWSVTARVVEGHELAVSGPYAYVRHPIYTGMLGLLLATGIAVSYWQAIIGALMVFLVGTIIRVRSEEKLLREAFGEKFEEYCRRVPALIPGVY